MQWLITSVLLAGDLTSTKWMLCNLAKYKPFPTNKLFRRKVLIIYRHDRFVVYDDIYADVHWCDPLALVMILVNATG